MNHDSHLDYTQFEKASPIMQVSYNGSIRDFQSFDRGSTPLTCSMSSKNKVYVVTMYRWGDKETHSYVIGAFTKKQRAIDECQKEEEYRGGKYNGEVLEFDPNATMRNPEARPKVIKERSLHYAFK